MATIQIKRVYEPTEETDGFRVLVDRLWPRGIKKARIDIWMKEVAPSAKLRKWFNHEPGKWKKFVTDYKAELHGSAALGELIKHLKEHQTLTLLYAAKDEEHNQALVLKNLLEEANLK